MSESEGRGSMESPQSRVRALFSEKSKDYAGSSLLTDRENLAFVLKMAEISGRDRVLDVATGTGFMAIAVADVGAEVIAADFTREMLMEARSLFGDRGNVSLALADADRLPFAEGSFDAVTCRVSVHHFANPEAAFNEMARVCRVGGRVMIMDVVSSEDPAKSELHNQMGRLRDSSEVRQYRLSELEQMIRASGLKVSGVDVWPHRMAFDEWIRLGGTDPETVETVRRMMVDSIEGDKAGVNPEYIDGRLHFTWRTGILVGRKEG